MATIATNWAIFGQSRRSLRSAVCLVVCTASVVLAFGGCSTSRPPVVQPPSNESPSVAVPVIPVPPQDVVPALVPKEEAVVLVPEENNIFFALRSALISETQKEKLRRHAARLKANRKELVVLVGHSDGQGSRNYNVAITEERLAAVEQLLRRYGVPISQIRRNRSASVRGTNQCSTDVCRQQMRRVELVFSP